MDPQDTAEAQRIAATHKLPLQQDYQLTLDAIKLLSDIRFRCLVFVTAIIAVANALLPGTGDSGTRIALGAIGFLATLGICVYELRNSQLYEAAIHRAKVLETLMTAVRTSEQSASGGLFNERPPYVEESYWKRLGPQDRKRLTREKNVALMSFLGVEVKHDQGLALIYAGALAGWIYLLADGILSLPALQRLWPVVPVGLPRVVAAILAVSSFALIRRRFIGHDKTRFRPDAPAADY